VILMLITALVGIVLAPKIYFNVSHILLSLCGIGLMSSAAAVINHILDFKIDCQMQRTHTRPIPRAEITQQQALFFATFLGVSGFLLLYCKINPITAYLTLFSLVGYAVIYTAFLKRKTSQNIVIGGLAGAMPPLLGWTSVTSEWDPQALILVMMIFSWTPAHFWALAIHKKQDYEKTNLPMLPITHGVEYTKTQVCLYSILFFLTSLLPYLVGLSGLFYLLGATILCSWFLFRALQLKFYPEQYNPIQFFILSNWVLLFIFLLLLFDYLGKFLL